jgi:hypothetical protein
VLAVGLRIHIQQVLLQLANVVDGLHGLLEVAQHIVARALGTSLGLLHTGLDGRELGFLLLGGLSALNGRHRARIRRHRVPAQARAGPADARSRAATGQRNHLTRRREPRSEAAGFAFGATHAFGRQRTSGPALDLGNVGHRMISPGLWTAQVGHGL